ncbi:hypothetical protein JZX87_09905 [Agrobacterium sp. Ap1]|uniref:hypothetical protein n=1 Tax=Agrobacterium sp. Ap1 TaxID=2815337 RepID=UPI001A8C5838|nr:hypothetical protein [Agrobacterium sp. Ap1]MBO0141476.1 hypothetical protein [Agrobacterium sp. Ap1]
MSVLRRPRNSPGMFEIGTKVTSNAVGNKPEFVGTVSGYFGPDYYVTDHLGEVWHRERYEIRKFVEVDA